MLRLVIEFRFSVVVENIVMNWGITFCSPNSLFSEQFDMLKYITRLGISFYPVY